ncbi:hypothetical protein C9J48_20425 [Photobacterium profundum]|uniref:Uncharacterized protein n=1 Tax=Photobacterium profundum 3TCK TaxID=314280 RepID=Q1Z4Z1_9GAMM|nr:hypothetical protein [Photobacterium profundum]EAS43480.1 hypothetical protein P3TCK_01449 [Photobacterium profundum 3TCK]PSV60265.1 hypothetical protein C9J48_20425 [Photobacterium profundum]
MIGKIIRWFLLNNIDDDIINEKSNIIQFQKEIENNNNSEIRKEMSKELKDKAKIRLEILENLKRNKK